METLVFGTKTMTDLRNTGFYSDNELFALKKNTAENAKLQEKIGCLSLQMNLTSDLLRRYTRIVREDLVEIRRSTGKSLDIPWVPINHEHVENLVQKPILRLPEISNQEDQNLKKKSNVRKIRAITGTLRTKNELGDVVTQAKRRKLKSEGGQSKTLLSINIGNPESGTLTIDTIPIACEDDVFSKSEKHDVKEAHDSGGKFEGTKHNEDQKIQENERNESQILPSNECNHSLNNKTSEYSNRWKVHSRTGERINFLSIPKLTDCYRPMCRPNCSTCLIRKKRGPCFLVPGFNISTDHFLQNSENTSDSEEHGSKTESIKSEVKKVSKISNTEKEDKLGDKRPQNVEQDGKSFELENFVKECLEIQKQTTVKRPNIARLAMLAKPKNETKRGTRFTKTSIRKELEKLKGNNPICNLSIEERRRLDITQGRVALFLAELNERRNSTIKPLNEILDFPVRENNVFDFSHLHQSITLPSFEKFRKSKERKVRFQDHVC